MQPLFEHGMRLDGYRTRVLELEGEGPALLDFSPALPRAA